GAAIRNFAQAYGAQLGFDPHNVLILDLAIPEKTYTTWEEGALYQERLLKTVQETPGVTSAATSVIGLPPNNRWLQPAEVVGSASNPGLQASVAMASADYFSVMRIPLLQGRSTTSEEIARGARMAVVSKTFVDRYFAGTNPIGHMIRLPRLSDLPPDFVTA